jgi:hypothetical protein
MGVFLPRKNADIAIWLTNYSTQIGTFGVPLGMAPADVTAEQKRCKDVTDAIHLEDQKRKDWRSAAESTRTLKSQELKLVRATVARIKTAPTWTLAIGQSLGVLSGSAQPVAMDTYKPKIRAQIQAGRVEIKFTRGPLGGINLYSRKRGEGTWHLLGRAQHSPIIDNTPFAAPGVSEIREYRALGVVKDQEVGLPSDVAVITLGE